MYLLIYLTPVAWSFLLFSQYAFCYNTNKRNNYSHSEFGKRPLPIWENLTLLRKNVNYPNPGSGDKIGSPIQVVYLEHK